MGKVRYFDIVFWENKTVYFSGEFVMGECILELSEAKNMRALRISMRGEANVHWTETHSRTVDGKSETYTESYSDKVEYFPKQTQVLVGQQATDTQYTLPAGRHVFNFRFQLPYEVSTSFQGAHGSIRYWLKAVIDKPWALDQDIKKDFTVIGTIDINKPEYVEPVENNSSKTICCWPCESGPITMNARADRRGYCSGESMAVSAEFTNNSSRDVIPCVKFYKSLVFYAQGKSKMESQKLAEVFGSSISASSKAPWNAQPITIPAVPSSILNCRIIKLEYYAQVELQIPDCCSSNLSVRLPIVIGTVPRYQPSQYNPNNQILAGYNPIQAPYNPNNPIQAPYNPIQAPYNSNNPMQAPYNSNNPIQFPYDPSNPIQAPYNPTAPPSYDQCATGAVDLFQPVVNQPGANYNSYGAPSLKIEGQNDFQESYAKVHGPAGGV